MSVCVSECGCVCFSACSNTLKVFVQSNLLLSVLLMCCPLSPQHWQRRHEKSFCHAASSRDSWTMLSKFPYWESSHHRVHKLPRIHLHKHKWIHAQRHFSRFHFREVRRRKQWAQIEKVSYKWERLEWMWWRRVKLLRCCLLCDQTIWGHTRIGLHETWGAVECAEHGWEADGKQ